MAGVGSSASSARHCCAAATGWPACSARLRAAAATRGAAPRASAAPGQGALGRVLDRAGRVVDWGALPDCPSWRRTAAALARPPGARGDPAARSTRSGSWRAGSRAACAERWPSTRCRTPKRGGRLRHRISRPRSGRHDGSCPARSAAAGFAAAALGRLEADLKPCRSRASSSRLVAAAQTTPSPSGRSNSLPWRG